MRSFIIPCLIALATADKLGYNYQPVGHSDVNFGRGDGVGAASNEAAAFSAGRGDAAFDGAGGFGGVADGGLEKEYYSFSANDEEFEQPEPSEQIANTLKQNIQVVFIKGPENRGLENAALNLAKHASEQRTAIYVLNKQANIADLANKFNAAYNHKSHRPEVHFVKYRTQEDAQHAQHTIQSQYDQLGGSSQSHNGGVAHVLDFASKGHIDHHRGNGGVASAVASNAAYLPPNFVRV